MSKLHPTCLLEACAEFFWENLYKFFINVGHSLTNFRLFVKKFSAVLSNCILINHRTFWVERFFNQRNELFWVTSTNEQKNIGFFSNSFHGVAKTAFYFFKRSFWGIFFVYHFRTISGKFSAIWQKFLINDVRIAFYVPIGTLRGEKVFWKKNKNFFVVFGHAMKFFWSLIKTFPRRIVKTACYLSMETFWVERTSNAKNDFSDQFPKLSKKVGAYRRFFSKDCQKDVLHFQGMNLTKTSNFE